MRAGMDSVFGLHHLAHAHNAETAGDSLAGLDARSMKRRPAPMTGDGLPGRGAGLAGRARAGVALPSVDTAEGFARAPGVGAGAGRRAAGRGFLAGRVRRPGSAAAGLAGLRGGVPRGRRARSGSARTACSCWRRPCSRTAPRSSGTGCCRRWRPGRRGLGAGLVRAGRGQRPGRDPGPRGPGRRGVAAVRAARRGARRAAFADRAFGLFRCEPGSERHRGLTYLMFDLRADGRHGTADPPARRRDRVRGDLPGRRVRARRRRDRRAGRRLADRDEHGQPRARPVAAQPRPVLRRGRPAGRAVAAGRGPGRHRAARPGRRRVDRRPGLPAAHPRRRRRGWRRAAGWAPSPAWARCSGPSSTWRCTRPRWTCSVPRPSCVDLPGEDGRWLDGYLFSLAGPIYAGTNEIQRTVIAERLLGLPR